MDDNEKFALLGGYTLSHRLHITSFAKKKHIKVIPNYCPVLGTMESAFDTDKLRAA